MKSDSKPPVSLLKDVHVFKTISEIKDPSEKDVTPLFYNNIPGLDHIYNEYHNKQEPEIESSRSPSPKAQGAQIESSRSPSPVRWQLQASPEQFPSSSQQKFDQFQNQQEANSSNHRSPSPSSSYSSSPPPPPPPPRRSQGILLQAEKSQSEINLSENPNPLFDQPSTALTRDLQSDNSFGSPAFQEVKETFKMPSNVNSDWVADNISSHQSSNQGQAFEGSQERIENNQQTQQNFEKEMPSPRCFNYCFAKLKRILKNKATSGANQGSGGSNKKVSADLFFGD